MKYHYVERRFTNIFCKGLPLTGFVLAFKPVFSGDLLYEHCQVGSLAGAAHLLNDNTGDLRSAQCEQKSLVELKGKS